MTTKREQLEQQIAALQAELDALPKVWDPKGGSYLIQSSGVVCQMERNYAQFRGDEIARGLTYDTREQAEAVSEILRKVGRLCAAEIEFGVDGKPPSFDEGSGGNYMLYISESTAAAIERGEMVL